MEHPKRALIVSNVHTSILKELKALRELSSISFIAPETLQQLHTDSKTIIVGLVNLL